MPLELSNEPATRLDDAVLTYDALDQHHDVFCCRWPDWRVLFQTRAWITGDKAILHLRNMDRPDLQALLMYIRCSADTLHAQAARDERFATSSALRWALAELQIPLIADLHPLLWLDSTPLVNEIHRRLAGDVA